MDETALSGAGAGGVRPAPVRARSPERRTTGAVLLVVVVATLLRGTEPFVWDAQLYWTASTAVVSGGDGTAPDPAFFSVRGVLAAVTFAPAALLTGAVGPEVAGAAVLAQNALLLGAVAAVLVPALLRPWRVLGTTGRWIAGGATWATSQGFAPFPLMDLYATAALLGAVALVGAPAADRRARTAVLLAAGGLLGYAFNIRPAVLPVAALLVLVAAFRHRVRALACVAGIAVALLPQLVTTTALTGRPALTPGAADAVVALQAGYGSYVVRYDTLPTRPATPSQFFCSPAMAEHATEVPRTATELALLLLRHPADAVPFSLQKVAAALHWPLAVPYAEPRPGVDAFVAVATTTIAVVGGGYLLASLWVRRRDPSGPGDDGLGVVAVMAGTVAVLVGSAPETRFALPLVVLGVCGTTAAVTAHVPRTVARLRTGLASAAVLLVLATGWTGLAHPAPPGPVTPAVCATADRHPGS